VWTRSEQEEKRGRPWPRSLKRGRRGTCEAKGKGLTASGLGPEQKRHDPQNAAFITERTAGEKTNVLGLQGSRAKMRGKEAPRPVLAPGCEKKPPVFVKGRNGSNAAQHCSEQGGKKKKKKKNLATRW